VEALQLVEIHNCPVCNYSYFNNAADEIMSAFNHITKNLNFISITMEGVTSLNNYIKRYKKNLNTATDKDLPLFIALHSIWHAT